MQDETSPDITRVVRDRVPHPGYGQLRVPQAGFMRNFYAAALKTRAEAFRGVRSNAPVPDGLFPLTATGIATAPIVAAAEAFLDSMPLEMQSAGLFGVDSDAWRSWCNFHSLMFRHGLCLHDLDPRRRDLALALMQATLSEHGFAQARDVMRMNRHLGEVTGNFAAFDEWYYWISIMGVPSPTAPWGWQIDGQHLAINCLVVGDQLVVSPTFFGAEPTRAESGAYAGLVLFAEEEALGLRLMRALDEPQRRRATIGRELPFDVFAHSFNDNLELDYQGLPARDMTATQCDMLLDLIRCYIERETPGHAALRLRNIAAHLDATHFAWIGDWGEGPFYYRIHSPVLLVEFDHQPGVTFANDKPSRRHIHTVLRTPNGNDYGKALIAQYYERTRRTPLRADASEAEAYDIRRHGKPMGVLSE